MDADNSFDQLMGRLKAGEEGAAREVFERFGQRLIALAGSRLQGSIRRKEDPEDVVQSVFKSFFLRNADGQFDLRDWDSLWGLLTIITLNKCGHRFDYFGAQRRNVRREVPLEKPSDDSVASWIAVARDPTPAEAALFTDTLEQLLNSLDAREREIFSLRLQGYTVVEIGALTRRSERTVHRILDRIRDRLQLLRDESSVIDRTPPDHP